MMKRIFILVAMLVNLLWIPSYASLEYAGTDSLGNQSYALLESSKLVKFTPKALEWSVVVKEFYSPEGRQNMIDIYNLHALDTKGLELVDYELKTYHFKIWGDKVGYRIDDSYGYTNTGRIVYKFGGWHKFESFNLQSVVAEISYLALGYLSSANHTEYLDEFNKLQS